MFMSANAAEIAAEARSLKASKPKKYHGWKMAEVKKQIGWARWQKLSKEEREPFHYRVASRPCARERDVSTGQYVHAISAGSAEASVMTLLPKEAVRRRKAQKRPCQRDLAAIGSAFMTSAADAMSTPRKEKQVVRRLFTAAIAEAKVDPRRAHNLAPGVRYQKERTAIGSAAQWGGDRKRPRLSDEALRVELDAHTCESCRVTPKFGGCTVRTLQGSLRRIWGSDGRLQSLYSYRHLCRRMKQSKLAVSRACRRSDVCEVCQCWDNDQSKRVCALVGQVRRTLHARLPGYWDVWPKKDEELKPENPHYMDSMATYVSSHATKQLSMRARESEAGLASLVELEGHATTQLQRAVAVATEWSMHFRLNQYLRSAMTRDLEAPERGHLFLMYDHQDFIPGTPHESQGPGTRKVKLP